MLTAIRFLQDSKRGGDNLVCRLPKIKVNLMLPRNLYTIYDLKIIRRKNENSKVTGFTYSGNR